MSLESQIADLVTATNGLITAFNAKKSGIDTAVAAAIAAIPEGRKFFYVHQVNGLDTNTGTSGSPLKSIDKALANTPFGGICSILLQADYNLAVDVVGLDGRYLEIRTDDSANKRTLRPAYYTNSGNLQQIAGFPTVAGAMVFLRELNIIFPTATGLPAVPSSLPNCFVRAATTSSTILLGLKMVDCVVTEAVGALATLMGASASSMALDLVGTSFPSGFGGRYVLAVAGGTNPNTLGNVLTNIPAL